MKNLEKAPLSSVQLMKELNHVRVTPDGRSLLYDIARIPDGSIATISWEMGKGEQFEISVSEQIRNGVAERREPTLVEVSQFIQVVAYALPESPLTLPLFDFVAAQGDDLHNMAFQSKNILQTRTLLNSGKK